jgi:hypothetical protein
MKWRDILGMLLIASGIGGVFYGIRAATGTESSTVVSTTCIGAGTMANFAAFRVMRDSSKRASARASSSASSSAATNKREEETTTGST